MDNIEEQYRQLYPNYEMFTKNLAQLIETLLNQAGIKYHIVECRTKSTESLVEKIKRKQEKYNDPLSQITNSCAIRIIVFYINDLEKVEQLLRDGFTIDETNSFNAISHLKEDQFGYLSSHVVISLNKSRRNLPEWKAYKSYNAEIQVPTVLQHAWAAISHELEYKKEHEIPSVLKRKLFRLAGLIELADEQFQVAKENHEEVESAILERKEIKQIKVFEEINLDTLINYFSHPNENLKKIVGSGVRAGFEVVNDDKILQSKQQKFLSDIIELSHVKGVRSLPEFDKYVSELAKTSLRNLKTVIDVHNSTWTASAEFLVLLLIVQTLDMGQIEKYDGKGWARDVWNTFKRSISLK